MVQEKLYTVSLFPIQKMYLKQMVYNKLMVYKYKTDYNL